MNTTGPRRQEILSLIADQSCRTDITDETTLGDIDMDSLDNVELGFAIEDHFGGNIIVNEDDIWTGDTTVKQVIDEVIAVLEA